MIGSVVETILRKNPVGLWKSSWCMARANMGHSGFRSTWRWVIWNPKFCRGICICISEGNFPIRQCFLLKYLGWNFRLIFYPMMTSIQVQNTKFWSDCLTLSTNRSSWIVPWRVHFWSRIQPLPSVDKFWPDCRSTITNHSLCWQFYLSRFGSADRHNPESSR